MTWMGRECTFLLQFPFEKNCGQDHLCEGDLSVNLSLSGWALFPFISRHTKAFASSILIGWEVLVFPFGSLSILEVTLTRMLAWAMAHEFPQSYPCLELIPTNFQWSLSPSLVLPPSACRPWWWGACWSSTWQLLCRMRVRIPMEPWSTSTTQQGCPINEC